MAARYLRSFVLFSLCIVLILPMMLLTGCGSSESTFRGYVYADGPVSNAELSVYDASGKKILQSDQLTADEQGMILLNAAKTLPADFRIVAEGGTMNGVTFDAVLSADIRGYQSDTDTIYVNPATTIVSAYLDKNTDADYAGAALAVKRFLEIPEAVDLPSGTQLSSETFNIGQFLQEAGDNGGIDSFVQTLLTEMEAGETHPFQEPLGLQGLASGLAIALAEGAAGYVGGELMGWGLDKAGINFGDEDHTAEELEKINEGMEEMKAEMAEMSIKLDAISLQLTNILEKLEDMLKQITHQQALSEYGTRVLNVNELISSIKTIRRDLNNFILNPGKDPEPMRKSLMNRIESNVIDNSDMIHNLLVGLAGEKPLLTLWREIVYEDRYLDWYDYEKIQSQFDFFRQWQEAILLLQVEYYHAMETEPGQNTPIIMDCINNFNEQLEKQESLLCAPIEKYTVVDTKWDWMFYSEDIEFGKPESAFKLAGKTKEQVKAYMSELAGSNYAGYDDWGVFDYDYFGALVEDHIFERAPWNWTEHMVTQGWPGVKIDDGTLVPFYELSNHVNLVCIINTSNQFKRKISYPTAGFQTTGYGLIMTARETEAADYGYEHLKK